MSVPGKHIAHVFFTPHLLHLKQGYFPAFLFFISYHIKYHADHADMVCDLRPTFLPV